MAARRRTSRLSQRELDLRSEHFARLFAQPGFERYDVEILDRAEMTRRLPGMGPEVVGGTWSAMDGDCNPLRLLRALDAGSERAGVVRLGRDGVVAIEPRADRFDVRTASAAFTCARVVLAAGLGNARLAPMVGMNAPFVPGKGRSSRWNACRRFGCHSSRFVDPMRDRAAGRLAAGAWFDESVTFTVLSDRGAAMRVFPFLRDVRAVRAWAALRVMSRDEFFRFRGMACVPGAFLATRHSGVTLAARARIGPCRRDSHRRASAE